MKNIIEMIEEAIEREKMKTGKMGSEVVSVTIRMTDKELEIFKDIDLFNSQNYSWEIEDKVDKIVKELKKEIPF